jgi:hypothetical protein
MNELDIQLAIDTEALFKAANDEMIDDYWKANLMKIKTLIHATNNLRLEIRQAEDTANKKRVQLKQKEEELVKIRSGDWSVLSKVKTDDKA